MTRNVELRPTYQLKKTKQKENKNKKYINTKKYTATLIMYILKTNKHNRWQN